MKIRERIEAEELLRFEELRSELDRAGVETPGDWADQMMRRVYEQIKHEP